MQLLCWNNLSHLFLQLMLPHRTHSHIAKSVTLDQKNVSGFLIKFFWTPIRWDSYHLHFLIVLLLCVFQLWPVYSFSKWLDTCDRCVCARVCAYVCVYAKKNEEAVGLVAHQSLACGDSCWQQIICEAKAVLTLVQFFFQHPPSSKGNYLMMFC